jgi:hypothetical protein
MPGLENCGVLHYDIPVSISRFGIWLRKELRKGKALPASKSVYLVNWSDVPRLQGVVDGAKVAYTEKYPEEAATLNRLSVAFLKFDNATGEEARRMAVEGMNRLIAETTDSLKKQIKKADGEGLPRAIQRKFIKRIKECKMLAIAFRLMEDVEGPMAELWTLVEEEIGAEVAAQIAKKAEARLVKVVA